MSDTDDDLKTTPLTDLHEKNGAKMVAFAGYRMPVQFKDGVLKEHLHTREAASLFDVSHMGQARLVGSGAVAALEKLVPADLKELPGGRLCYTQLTNASGGIIDDLIVTRAADHLYLVVNAARKEIDFAHIREHLEGDLALETIDDHALIALQGPKAVDVLSDLTPAARHMLFRSGSRLRINEIPCFVTRSGYTGEDGFEISCPAEDAIDLATLLEDEERVRWAGLGARDSLRLEAGLCLYGQDIDETTTPVEASLTWSIGKRRRKEGGFIGADVILEQVRNGASRYRVGLQPEGRAPTRAGTEIFDKSGNRIGQVTSGGFGPSVDSPIAMGYVDAAFHKPGTDVVLVVRNKEIRAKVVELPFIELKYRRN